METATVVFDHPFDRAMLDHIGSLRSMRLTMAESMLRNLTKTAHELGARGLLVEVDSESLRAELVARVQLLKGRMAKPDVVYADEIALYVELLEGSAPDED